MSKHLVTLLTAMLLFATMSHGEEKVMASSPEEGLRLFAQCDAALFQALKKSPDIFGTSVQVEPRGAAATLVVPNPLSPKLNEQAFKSPVPAAGLRLLAWHNEVAYDVDMGAFLFWGFKVEGNPATVAAKINALLPERRRLSSFGVSWAHAEKRVIGDPIGHWSPGGESGVATQKGTVERVLLIDQDAPGVSILYCSLQGSVTAPLLQTLRPDLLSKEYPQ